MQLTIAEYNTGYNKVLKTFANSQTSSWESQVYKVRNNYDPVKGKMLFLFAFALSTWEHSDSAANYLTEVQVLAIIKKTNQVKWT